MLAMPAAVSTARSAAVRHAAPATVAKLRVEPNGSTQSSRP